jgi:hypothetical protein
VTSRPADPTGDTCCESTACPETLTVTFRNDVADGRSTDPDRSVAACRVRAGCTALKEQRAMVIRKSSRSRRRWGAIAVESAMVRLWVNMFVHGTFPYHRLQMVALATTVVRISTVRMVCERGT